MSGDRVVTESGLFTTTIEDSVIQFTKTSTTRLLVTTENIAFFSARRNTAGYRPPLMHGYCCLESAQTLTHPLSRDHVPATPGLVNTIASVIMNVSTLSGERAWQKVKKAKKGRRRSFLSVKRLEITTTPSEESREERNSN